MTGIEPEPRAGANVDWLFYFAYKGGFYVWLRWLYQSGNKN